MRTQDPHFYINADVGEGGELRVEITDVDATPIPGFELDNCLPITGDSVSHPIRWKGDPSHEPSAGPWIRLRVTATNARVYALFCGREEEIAEYWNFHIPHHRGSLWDKLPEFHTAERQR